MTEITTENFAQTHASFIEELQNAPRITALASDFEDIAAGRKGKPFRPVPLNHNLLGYDALVCTFGESMYALAGHFEEHIAASIPYMCEERARQGAAILLHGLAISDKEHRPVNVYTSSSAEATLARTIAAFSYGRISTVSCSPTEANLEQFHQPGVPQNSNFFLGPYFDVTPTELANRNMPQFEDGFDVVVEETTFQMYHRNRADQIGLISRNLKPGGVLLMVEKLDQEKDEEFTARERQKDEEFKPLYFDEQQILQKRQSIVSKMNNMLVTLDELSEAIGHHFNAAVVTFNAGNFYNVAASDDPENLAAFIGRMIPPAVPRQYQYCDVPEILFGPANVSYEFANPDSNIRGKNWAEGFYKLYTEHLSRRVALKIIAKHAILERTES